MTAYNNPQQPIEPYIAEVTQAVQDAGGGLSDIYRIQDEQARGIDVYPAQGTNQPR